MVFVPEDSTRGGNQRRKREIGRKGKKRGGKKGF